VALIFIISAVTNIITLIPYVPSKTDYLKYILRNLKRNCRSKNIRIYDLGCGDGRLLFLAEQLGFQAKGYENSIGPFLYAYLKKHFIRSKVKIVLGSLFKADLKNADIVFIYLLPYVFDKLVPKIKKECRKGTIIVSSGFQVPGLNFISFKKRINHKQWPSIHYYEV